MAFSFTVTGLVNDFFTMTATRTVAPLDTSEFSGVVRAAQTLVVDTTSDANLTACTAAANDCSLRGAINNANANAGADTITFAASVTGTITLGGTQLPVITDNATITGPGVATLAVSGNNASRVWKLRRAKPFRLVDLRFATATRRAPTSPTNRALAF